jgi:hypothetical protein
LKGECISKKEYKKAIEGQDMRLSFAKQISISAHSWTDLILERYLEKIPCEIIANSKDLQETKNKKVKDKEQISKAEQTIIDANKIIIQKNDKITNL